jgi:hypothetical protein
VGGGSDGGEREIHSCSRGVCVCVCLCVCVCDYSSLTAKYTEVGDKGCFQNRFALCGCVEFYFYLFYYWVSVVCVRCV